MATNAALDELRRRSRRPTPGLPELDGRGAAAGDGAAVGASPGGIEGLIADRLDINAALGDLEYAEIADILGLPPGTVRSRIARGRGQLADLMRSLEASPGNRTTATDRPTTSP